MVGCDAPRIHHLLYPLLQHLRQKKNIEKSSWLRILAVSALVFAACGIASFPFTIPLPITHHLIEGCMVVVLLGFLVFLLALRYRRVSRSPLLPREEFRKERRSVILFFVLSAGLSFLVAPVLSSWVRLGLAVIDILLYVVVGFVWLQKTAKNHGIPVRG